MTFDPSWFGLPEAASTIVREAEREHFEQAKDAVLDRMALATADPASVFDLTDSMCKFPIGDPSEADFAFCGRESSHGPYCKDHARLAYQPSGEGEKRRKAA